MSLYGVLMKYKFYMGTNNYDIFTNIVYDMIVHLLLILPYFGVFGPRTYSFRILIFKSG